MNKLYLGTILFQSRHLLAYVYTEHYAVHPVAIIYVHYDSTSVLPDYIYVSVYNFSIIVMLSLQYKAQLLQLHIFWTQRYVVGTR